MPIESVQPVNKVIVQRLDSKALGFGTMVFKIPESVSDHNIVMELLRAIRHKYPGPWYCFLDELRKEREADKEVGKVKEVNMEET